MPSANPLPRDGASAGGAPGAPLRPPPRRHTWSEVPWLLRSAPGRWALWSSAVRTMRPALMPPAAAWRRWAIPDVRVIAVVGSFGKTTTVRALTAASTPQRRPVRNGEPYVAWDLLCTGPRESRVVYETAIARPGRMAPFARMVRPDVVVATAVGSEHRSALGGLEQVRDEKAHMVRALGASGAAVLNADDPHVDWMATQTRARVVRYGFGERADVRAMHFEAADGGSRLAVRTPERELDLRTRLIGRAMAYPVLATIATALVEGLSLGPVLEALEALEPTPGRLQWLRLDSGISLLCDDHKSALETMERALDALAEAPAARRIAVMGDVQERAEPLNRVNRELGRRAAASADRVFFVGSARAARPFRSGAREGGLAGDDIVELGAELPAAIAGLRGALRPGDVVLFKGRQSHWLQRLALGAAGRGVRCEREPCKLKVRCESCPLLGRRARR